MKKFTLLFIIMLLGITGVDAKSSTTTLWEDDYKGIIDIAASSLSAGKTLTIYMDWKGAEGCGLGVSAKYTKTDGLLSDGVLPSLGDIWPWQNNATASMSFELSEGDMEKIESSGYLYISSAEAKKMIISKITLTETFTPTSETELLDESWVASWDAKVFAAQSSAKIGDVIRVQFTAYKDEETDWTWVQFYFMDGGGNNLVDPVAASKQKNAVMYFEFEIVSADVLAKIQTGGFSIKGDQFVLNSVKLLTYADSYDAVSIIVGGDGVATYSNGGKNVQISACDALKAYYASAVAEGTVTLTELTGCIPANTGVMIYGAEGTYTVPVGGEGWPSISQNYLKATGDYSANVEASTEGTYHYIFAKDKSDNIGFFKLEANHTLAAHKAYLETSNDITPSGASGSARLVLRFEDEDDPTAIGEVKSAAQPVQADNVYYNLNGQRVEKPTKGIYILNGKKVLF